MQIVLALGLLLQASIAFAANEKASPKVQVISLGLGVATYNFAVYSGTDLSRANAGIRRAVILQHGIRRDADRYFSIGMHSLAAAQLDLSETMLLAPAFLTASDNLPDDKIPLWRGDNWMQCQASSVGAVTVNSCAALDDIARYIANGDRFPALKEIIFIGHSAGGQLMQRYAVLNNAEEALRKAGISV
ncbi:MAG: hypothetical protein O9327_06785, partial [Polaromonas sp.]|nr:hypothetical protein [Polaromonas sp.]